MLAFRVASIGVLSGHRCLQSPADTAASRKISWKALPCTTVDPSNMSSRAHFNWPLPRKGPPPTDRNGFRFTRESRQISVSGLALNIGKFSSRTLLRVEAQRWSLRYESA